MNKIIERTCIGCNSKKDKKELIRIVKNKNGEIFVDLEGKADGRGAYLCKNENCLDKVIKNKRLEKALETKLENNIYENIRGVILG